MRNSIITSVRKRAKKQLNDDDSLFSQLPDDILIIILSFLTVKEAGRTSVLSPRWIDLWKHISCLIFESPTALDRVQLGVSHVKKTERHNFVKWLNMVLEKNKAPVIKEFNVCFSFGKQHSSSVRKWLRYVFTHHVERLELNFSAVRNQCDTQCTLPMQLLNTLQPSFDFKPLKLMSLKAVDVSSEDLGFFLDNCPFLEKIVVWYSRSLGNVEISGFSLKLKHLEICYCNLESLKVCNTNIVSLSVVDRYSLSRYIVPILGPGYSHRGNRTIWLNNLPSLSDVSINNISTNQVPSMLSCCISQLVALNVSSTRHEEETELLECPELTKLKKLVLGVSQCRTDEVKMHFERFGFERLTRIIAPLIRAAPFLQEFVLELHWRWSFMCPDTPKEFKRAELLPLQFLKVLKISGFTGQDCEFEFIEYFMEYAIALKTIIIDLHNQLWGGDWIKAMDSAKQFQREIPQHIHLLILQTHTTKDSRNDF